MKKVIVLLMLFVIATIVAACGSAADQGTPGDSSNTLTLAQMQHDPMSFTGQISVEGIVGNYGRFNFSLSGENVDFELAIDYRGNQSLPEIGTVIVATGRMNYRSCCGPHLISTRFEVTEQ